MNPSECNAGNTTSVRWDSTGLEKANLFQVADSTEPKMANVL